MKAATQVDLELADEIGKFYADPLGFVRFAYPWGEPNTELANEPGPDPFQEQFLIDVGKEVRAHAFDGASPVMPVRMAASSGHGTGKSVLGAWIADWILSTRPNSIGTVTANTRQQLQSRTWAAIQHWTRLCITAHWFVIGAKGVHAKAAPESWKISAQTCKPENAQAFAGQHARTSTSWYMFDEASNIPDGVWEVAFGGLTDGEPMFFAWGQPTRKTGTFYQICFGKQRDRWDHRSIDSRTSRFTNKQFIAEQIEDWGEDSDYVRVRIKGLAPSSDDLQFIPDDLIRAAQKRDAQSLPDDPLIAGVDVSGGGAAWNVVRFRKGLDAKSIPPVRISGEQGRDRNALVGKLAEILRDPRPERQVAMMFVDASYGAVLVERLKVLGFKNVAEINFGARCPDPRHYANMRAYMWDRMKAWLEKGAIPDEERLETDLGGPSADTNRQGLIVLESKESMAKRGVASPDDGDALALTFAQPVAPVRKRTPGETHHYHGEGSWMA